MDFWLSPSNCPPLPIITLFFLLRMPPSGELWEVGPGVKWTDLTFLWGQALDLDAAYHTLPSFRVSVFYISSGSRVGITEVMSVTVVPTLRGPDRVHISITVVLDGVLTGPSCLAFRPPRLLLYFMPAQPPKLFQEIVFLFSTA